MIGILLKRLAQSFTRTSYNINIDYFLQAGKVFSVFFLFFLIFFLYLTFWKGIFEHFCVSSIFTRYIFLTAFTGQTTFFHAHNIMTALKRQNLSKPDYLQRFFPPLQGSPLLTTPKAILTSLCITATLQSLSALPFERSFW